jgi:hypothetical protein
MQGIQPEKTFSWFLSKPPYSSPYKFEMSLEFVQIGDLGLSKIKQRTLVSGGIRDTVPWVAPELLKSHRSNFVTEKVKDGQSEMVRDVYLLSIV